jgi:two-component system sensor histidine kinase UhpB
MPAGRVTALAAGLLLGLLAVLASGCAEAPPADPVPGCSPAIADSGAAAEAAAGPGGCEGASSQLWLTQALVAPGDTDHFPNHTAAQTLVPLPDDWDRRRSWQDGPMWYRLRFDTPPGLPAGTVLAAYIERACSNLEVRLNGRLLHAAGRMRAPVTRSCYYSQLINLPQEVLLATGNRLDIKVAGHTLQRVGARQRGGGLSEVRIGPLTDMQELHERHLLLGPWLAVTTGCMLVLLGGLAFVVAVWRHAPYLGYFGAATMLWGLLSARFWWRDIPLGNTAVEWITCALIGVVAVVTVLFLLRYCGLRLRRVELALWAQCVVLPATLVLAGGDHLFRTATAWYVVLMAEVLAAMVAFLLRAWRFSRVDFWIMGAVILAQAAMLLVEVLMQNGWIPHHGLNVVQFAAPILFIAIGARIVLAFMHALQATELAREEAERRVREITADMERNYAQMSELQVEQVTAKERKRIAADLHDDLGAKLLTIVHTSESERIATLAREALEEMRLSVRGITGKPVNLGDALGDWRSEAMSRLSDGGVELSWNIPTELEFSDRTIGARIYVQTTRILREAVSNLLKHSGASHCDIGVRIDSNDLEVTIADNGRGIPMELDGKLDRGHGMASMKHRAKQMQGQCLVESGPGYGTVIRLMLPL